MSHATTLTIAATAGRRATNSGSVIFAPPRGIGATGVVLVLADLGELASDAFSREGVGKTAVQAVDEPVRFMQFMA